MTGRSAGDNLGPFHARCVAFKDTKMVRIATLIFAALLCLPAFAAGEGEGDITLKIERGGAMTSQGGEFISAKTGQVVVEGERLMVSEGAVVVLR